MTFDAQRDAEMRRLLKFTFQQAPLRFLRRMMLRWLKGIYKTFPKGCYRYIPDADERSGTSKESDIHIAAKAPWRPDKEEQRPAIIYNRMMTQGNYMGMGAGPNVQEAVLSTNHLQKTKFNAGTILINCVSRVGDEAEHLAWLVYFWASECIDLITKLGFHHIGEPSIGQTSPAPDTLVASSETEWVFCAVTMPYTFQYSWESNPEQQAQIDCIQVDLVDEVNKILQQVIAERGDS